MSYYRTCPHCGVRNIDLTGKRFGRLTVMGKHGPGKDRHILWYCLCDCGNETIVASSDLRSGHTQSCGCIQREKASQSAAMVFRTHGQSRTRLYHIWDGMRYRCTSHKCKSYPHYGGRGITVCPEWLHNFEAFQKWALSHGYQEDLTIDRIDNDKGYSPDNCRWATVAEQNRNKRRHKNAPVSVTSTDKGEVDQIESSASTSYDT